MTQERIDIVVSERGAKVVKRSLEDIGQGAANADKTVGFLKNTLATVATLATLKSIQNLVDTYTNLQNRLRLVTNGVNELTVVTQELFNISNQTRSSYESTAELFSRVALSVKELGVSQQETLDFTKSLNQAVILSGANTAEASAGIIQLAQGMASGTLRGDELRSVLEQLPAVADVIAKGLGVTRGELRQMGADGQITAEMILKAFRDARVELDEKFGTTIPTIGQSFTVLQNKITEMIGKFDTASGISAEFAKAILWVSNNLDIILKVLTPVAVTLGVALAGVAIPAAIAGFKALWVIILANPILTLVAAVASVITYFGGWDKTVVAFQATFVAFTGEMIKGGNGLVATAQAIYEGFKGAFSAIGDIFTAFKADLIAFLLNPTENYGFENLRAKLDEGFVGAFKGAYENVMLEAADFNKQIDASTQEAIDKLAQRSSQLDNPAAPVTADLGVVPPRTAPYPTSPADAEAAKIAQEAEDEAAQRKQQLIENIIGPQRDLIENQTTLNELLAEGTINTQQYNEAMAQSEMTFLNAAQPTNFADGFINQLRKMQLETRNVTADMGKQFAEIFGPGGTLIKGIGDATAQAIVFGKDFKTAIGDVARSILTQLISSLVQVGLNMLINAALGTALQAAALATTTATASATAAAWAPAAALVSLATLGTNAAAATTGITTTMATTQGLAKASAIGGFEEGGYTGDMGRSQVAGVVHGQEFVMNASATKRNLPLLEAMNSGKSVSGSGGSSSGLNVTIVNQIPDAAFETRQVSPGEVEIIARRVVREEAPNIVAADMANPNSKTSKALSQNTNMERRRA